MTSKSETTAVSGGWIKREAASGRFIEVRSSEGISKASPKSRAVVKEASARRSSALKRLADR